MAFGGMNMSDGASDGELSDCRNLSARRFPLLAPRKGRRLLAQYGEASSAFEWDGKQAVVADGMLYYDGEAIDNVAPGEKQWAVVNTKLCIFPDKVCLDLTNRKFERLDAAVQTAPEDGNAVNVTVTGDSITAALNQRLRRDVKMSGFSGNAIGWSPSIYTYGREHEAFKACWDAEQKIWNFPEGMEKLSCFFGGYGDGRYGIDNESSGYQGMIGQIFIPKLENNAFSWVWGDPQKPVGDIERLPDKSLYNREGYYGVITGYYKDWTVDIYGGSQVSPTADFYQVGRENPLFSALLKPGDVVSITGTPYGLYDKERTTITDIEDETNTLRFAQETFRIIEAVYEKTEVNSAVEKNAYYQLKYAGKYYYFKAAQTLEQGQVLLLGGDKKTVQAWDPTEKRALWEVTATVYDERLNEVPSRTMQAVRFTQSATIQRDVPDLDFICESGNRLWGVSNNQKNRVYNSDTMEYEEYTSRCIYASALGDPTAFWQFKGVDTDSYQVAVGSEGNFTAICEYNEGVCCWKEGRLHRVLGSYPSEYYMSERALAGVQKGSHKSLVNINETLFYKGVSGVYAYGGGAPSLISSNFGEHRFWDAVAGSDGTQYFISMREGDEWQLLVYDTVSGLWLREDETRVIDFCLLDGRLRMLTEDGALLETGMETDTDRLSEDEPQAIEWSATFAPFAESGNHERKNYLRTLLRMEQGGGQVTVSVKRNGEWSEVKTLKDGENTAIVPIFPGRVDQLQIRLTGTAPCAVLSMAREYLAESIYAGENAVGPEMTQ